MLTSKKPRVVNPFSVSIQSSGKKRLIADHLKKYLKTPSFKIDDLNTAMPSLEEVEFLFAFDLEKGYYHIDLDPEVQDFFGFAFQVNGKTYYSRYTIGPFGLASMPLLFTSLLKPLFCKGEQQVCTSTFFWTMALVLQKQRKKVNTFPVWYVQT